MKSKAPKRNYQICKRCVMDTSDPWIIFDERGLCNHCRDFLDKRLPSIVNSKKDKSSLVKMFDDIKTKSRKGYHDVLIGISGGVDSSFALLMAQKAGLKILAVHMDNGWDAPIAIKNINKLIQLDGVDYECEVLDWNNFEKSNVFLLNQVCQI